MLCHPDGGRRLLVQDRHKEYKRKVNEKARDAGIAIPPLTSLRHSIDPHVIKLFVLSKCVPETTSDAVTEDSFSKCIKERVVVQIEDYDLALI